MLSLSKEETQSRFGVDKAIEHFPSSLTSEEEKYVKTVLQYMDVSQPFFHLLLSRPLSEQKLNGRSDSLLPRT